MPKKNYKKVNVALVLATLMIFATIITPICFAIPRGHDVIGYNNEESSDDWEYPLPYQGIPDKNSFFSSGIKFKNNLGEYLIPDEYNLDTDGAGHYKWYPADMIVFQSFVPDCNKIGAFGVALKTVTYEYDDPDVPLPAFTIGLYPQTTEPLIHNGNEYNLGPRPDIDKPLWHKIGNEYDADGWVGLEYGPNWQTLVFNPDGFFHLEDQGYSPNYITVIPSRTYYIGIQLLDDHPRDICGGYALECTNNRYSQGCRSDLDWYDPHDVGFPPNYNIHESSDIAFCVWGWDYSPEMPCDPDPENGEYTPLVKYGEDDPFQSHWSPHDGKLGVYLSCLVDDPDDNMLEVSFYGTIAQNPNMDPNDLVQEEYLIGSRLALSGTRPKIFWPDIVYSGDIPYVWAVVARDWGIQRLHCPTVGESESIKGLWSFHTLPYGDPGPDAPVVQDIPNQTICDGEKFAEIHLDDYVDDPDDPDKEIEWTYSGNIALNVEITPDRNAIITYPDHFFIGSETITFTATDKDKNSDFDDATFTVVHCPQNVSMKKLVRDYCDEEWSERVEVDLFDLVVFKLNITYKGGKTVDLVVTDKLPSKLMYYYIDDENYEPDVNGNTLTWEFSEVQPGETIEIIFGAKAVDCGTAVNWADVVTSMHDRSEDSATVVVLYEPDPGDDDDDDDSGDDDDDSSPGEVEIFITKPLEEGNFLYYNNQQKFPFLMNLIIGAIDINATVSDTTGQITDVKFFVGGEEIGTKTYTGPNSYVFKWDQKAMFWNIIEIAAFAGTNKVSSKTIDVFAFVF